MPELSLKDRWAKQNSLVCFTYDDEEERHDDSAFFAGELDDKLPEKETIYPESREDAEDDGRWVTTEEGHHVHLNENGEPDKGNPHVLDAMRGGRKHKVAQGKDISKTYKGKKDIKSVMKAQGFDGLPRVVGKKEFDEAVKASSFVAQRVYSASSQRILDAYRDQLYNGDWYVECSEGGAQYGQGMYCAADYNGELSDGIREEMQDYKDQQTSKKNVERLTRKEWRANFETAFAEEFGENPKNKKLQRVLRALEGMGEEGWVDDDARDEWQHAYYDLPERTRSKISKISSEAELPRQNKYSNIETMTLSPDAKIISYDEIATQRDSEAPDMDVGAYAASKGYDAINAEGHGRSGSYTVILNRTKVIFLQDDEDSRADAEDDGAITFQIGPDGIIYAIRNKKVIGWVKTQETGEINGKANTDAADDDDGRWITTENGHHVHLNEEGEPDKGNPHVIEAMESGEKTSVSISKRSANERLAELGRNGDADGAKEILDSLPVGSKLKLPDSWFDSGKSETYIKDEDGIWKATNGERFEAEDVAGWVASAGDDDAERPEITSVAREKKPEEPDETEHTPPKETGPMIERHTTAYRNPYVSDEQRAEFRDHVQKVINSYGFNPNDPKSYASLGKQIQDEINARFKLRKKNGDASKYETEPQAIDVYDVLQDIRQFGRPSGESDVSLRDSELPEDRTQDILDEAFGRFPTDWFAGDSSDNGCNISILDSAGRAHMNPGWQWSDGIDQVYAYARESQELMEELHLESDEKNDYAIANEVAHEMGHHFERSNWRVGSLCRDYLERRTRNDEIEEYYPGEYVKRDKFADPYMGKQYLDGSTEILSVLVQKLGYVDPRQAIATGFMGTEKDFESYRFVLGILAAG